MSTRIEAIEHSLVYRHFAKKLRKERVAITKQDTKTKYLGYFEDEQLVGVVGWLDMGNGHIRYKTDYVDSYFRGKGIYTHLYKSRNFLIFQNRVSYITAYCTPMSLPMYLKNNFKQLSISKTGIAYVKQTTDEKLQTMDSRI